MNDLLGQDLAWRDGDLVIDHTGDVAIDDGESCLATDLVHRLSTGRGSYFRHPGDGLDVAQWQQAESSPHTHALLCRALEDEAERDPRVRPGSARARVVAASLHRVDVRLTMQPVDEDHELNLLIRQTAESLEVSNA